MASKPFAFSRASRLLSPEQYAAALRARPFARTASFTCHWCRNQGLESGEFENAKLGFIIPKRLIRLSTQRNAIKRVLREAFRYRHQSLPPGYYVFRLKAPLVASSIKQLKRKVREQADMLLDQAGVKR